MVCEAVPSGALGRRAPGAAPCTSAAPGRDRPCCRCTLGTASHRSFTSLTATLLGQRAPALRHPATWYKYRRSGDRWPSRPPLSRCTHASHPTAAVGLHRDIRLSEMQARARVPKLQRPHQRTARRRIGRGRPRGAPPSLRGVWCPPCRPPWAAAPSQCTWFVRGGHMHWRVGGFAFPPAQHIACACAPFSVSTARTPPIK